LATTSSWYKSETWTLADEGNKSGGVGGSTGGKTTRSDKVLKSYRHAVRAFTEARTASEKAVRYVNNNSWSSEEVTNAKKLKKPTLKYNIIVPIISTLQGNEQLNRRRARFKPTTTESVDICDIIQGRWNSMVDEHDLEDKLQIAFVDALSTRVGGWIQRGFKISDDGYLDFHYEVLNNMRVFPDPETKGSDYRLKKCRWIIKEGWEPLSVIKEKYGLKPEEYRDVDKVSWWNQLTTVFQRFTNNDFSSTNSDNYDKENDRYKILEMQERVTRKMYRIFDGENYMNIPRSDFNKISSQNPNIQKISEFDDDRIHITTIIPFFKEAVVLDMDMPNPTSNFDVFPVFSYNYNMQVSEQTSLVDLLMDVQDDVNKAKSQVRDYVTQILSGGIFIDKREKETVKKLKTHGNQPNQVYELNNPQLMPQKMPPQTVPPDILTNSENSFAYAQRVSLVSEAMKGETSRSGESGVLFEAKVERAAAAINPYFKNLSRLRKALAEDFLDNFGWVYSEDNRIIDLKQEGVFSEAIINLTMAGQTINSVKNPSVYVELDEGEDNVTNKEENFNKMLAMVNVIGQINPSLVDIQTLVEYAPIKGSDKMVQYIENMLQSQAESAQEQGDIQRTKALLENQKIERGMITDEEKLRIENDKVNKQKGAS
jgi:hypothetical protein|tara:strand:- start:22 stop:1983 length:1962 start_codon:yes stop_codon:yes gene_type:complete